MQINFYYKCVFCGSVSNLKYQAGFSKRHPIRYKCSCKITIKGEYREWQGKKELIFKNVKKINDDTRIDFVVHSSGDLLTIPQHQFDSSKDSAGITTFLLATMDMNLDYDSFREEFIN